MIFSEASIVAGGNDFAGIFDYSWLPALCVVIRTMYGLFQSRTNSAPIGPGSVLLTCRNGVVVTDDFRLRAINPVHPRPCLKGMIGLVARICQAQFIGDWHVTI